MKISTLIALLIFIIISIPAIFLSGIFIGFATHEKTTDLNTKSFIEFKEDISKEYDNIRTIKTYYGFGRVIFDIEVTAITVDECKEVAREIKDFVKNMNFIEEGLYSEQESIYIKIASIRDVWEFQCPHEILTEDGNDNPNEGYRIWYMSVNGSGEVKIEL